MKKVLAYLKAKIWTTVIVVAVLGAGGWYFVFRDSGDSIKLVHAERRDIVQTVEVTGAVKAASTINLEFLSSGKVVSRPREVGDAVSRGTLLMALDSRDIEFKIAKAEAELASSKAKLEQLKVGATAEELRQLENAVNAAYTDALSFLDVLLTKADKALITLRADMFLQNNNTVRTDLSLPSDASTAEVEGDKAKAEIAVSESHSLRKAADISSKASLDDLFSRLPLKLDLVRVLLVDSSNLLRRATSPTLSQATINTFLTDIATARSEFETATNSFLGAVSDIGSARDALRVKVEPPRQIDLDVLEAGVRASEAELALLKKQKEDAFLVSPVDGVITNLEYEVGEIARVDKTAVSLISSAGVEIESNVPEIDISEIAIGNLVKITLDALAGEVFSGKVVHIDPAETVVDGVINYKIKISFDTKNPRIKTGVTANLSIETMRKAGALSIPQYVVSERDGKSFVKRLEGKNEIEIPVELGARGSDGYVEVISGLSEGDGVLDTASGK